ncbi:alginate export family protein, partial [Brucella melitensis]
LAHQFHPGEDVSAWAYYGTVGYLMKEIGWTPSLSYRYAYFSGDDPNSSRYERFDPLLSTGLGIWLQGVSFGKITTNSNLETHRVQFNVAPDERLNLTFDYYLLRTPQLNNLGSNPALSTLSSHDLGQELSLSARWSATKSLYLQALVSHAIPGTALRDIGADRNWTTFQVSLYGGF